MLRRPRGNALGKLKRVAARWATGGRGAAPASVVDDGDPTAAATRAELARRQRPSGEADIEVAPDEVDAVALFLAMGTQWRRCGVTGRAIGLEYAAVPATASLSAIAMTPALFADLQLMEAAALKELLR